MLSSLDESYVDRGSSLDVASDPGAMSGASSLEEVPSDGDRSPRSAASEDGAVTPSGCLSFTGSLDGDGAVSRQNSLEKQQNDKRSAKAAYLAKLGVAGPRVSKDTVYVTRDKRPQQHCTLIIFDWDDTILCTSAIQSAGGPPSRAELSALALEASSLLTMAKSLGTVMIITNGAAGWVEQSCSRYLPELLPCLADIDIVSAREKFAGQYPDFPTQWKIAAFCEVKENSQTIANLVALGDQAAEMDALHEMAKLYRISYTKTLRFKMRPQCVELRKELQVVKSKLVQIVASVKDLDIKLKRPAKEVIET